MRTYYAELPKDTDGDKGDKRMTDLEIYTKVCLSCVMGNEWAEIQTKLTKAGYNLKVKRTTYDRSLHEKATELWGGDNYLAFASFPDGKVVALGAIKGMFEEIKDKRVKAGKIKPVRKGKKNVQRLRKTKRPIRVDYVEDSPSEVEVEIKA